MYYSVKCNIKWIILDISTQAIDVRTVQSCFGSPELWGKVRKLGLGPDAQSTRPACFDPAILSKDPNKFKKSLKGYKVWLDSKWEDWGEKPSATQQLLPFQPLNKTGMDLFAGRKSTNLSQETRQWMLLILPQNVIRGTQMLTVHFSR